MRTRQTIAIVLGGLFWAGLVASAVWASRQEARPDTLPPDQTATSRPVVHPPVTEQLWEYLSRGSTRLALAMPPVPARPGDPIFTLDDQGRWVQVGYLTGADGRPSATHAEAVWYAESLPPAEFRFEYYRNRGRFADILQMMLPPERRKRVEGIIREAIEENGEEIADAMRPVITDAMRRSGPVVERALKDSVARHREELEAIGERYREVILKDRLVPLIRDEVIPIVRKHGEPVANQIGRELWDRASLWRFGWRALYDRTPLPERDLFRGEWERFVEEEAIPVFESHMEDLVRVQRDIIVDVSRNEQVQQELREVAKIVATDRQLQRVLGNILRESIVQNDQLRAVWTEALKTAEARAALKLAGDRLEPVVRQIGDELFGTREGGITPSFARVLRNQILGKDRRWIVAVHDPGAAHPPGPIPVDLGDSTMVFPLTILAAPEEPLVEN